MNEELQDGQVLVVGDSPLGIRCGRAIRARVLATAAGGATLDELKTHQPDWAVADLGEIEPAVVVGPLERGEALKL